MNETYKLKLEIIIEITNAGSRRRQTTVIVKNRSKEKPYIEEIKNTIIILLKNNIASGADSILAKFAIAYLNLLFK